MAQVVRVLVAGALVVGALVPCVVHSGCWDPYFHCSRDSQCVLGSAAGACEPDGYCSFPAAACPSGRRYGGYSRLHDACVPPGPAVDGGGSCGDGVLEPGELCDPDIPPAQAGACPSPPDCDDNNPCTRDSVDGAAAQCGARCGHEFITACGPADHCCQAGCTASSDPDCSATCGNGIVEPGEACDRAIAAGNPGACPTSCAQPANRCTPAVLIGDASVCTATCVTNKITMCASGDGCCPPGCNGLTDLDCLVGG